MEIRVIPEDATPCLLNELGRRSLSKYYFKSRSFSYISEVADGPFGDDARALEKQPHKKCKMASTTGRLGLEISFSADSESDAERAEKALNVDQLCDSFSESVPLPNSL
mmetsp:Transcript_12601/g.31975  ORF Transcript_12601/g.31975 Transcript_12601/m.31975 type:complete len:109 (+) Transcript_12601:286-612(+)